MPLESLHLYTIQALIIGSALAAIFQQSILHSAVFLAINTISIALLFFATNLPASTGLLILVYAFVIASVFIPVCLWCKQKDPSLIFEKIEKTQKIRLIIFSLASLPIFIVVFKSAPILPESLSKTWNSHSDWTTDKLSLITLGIGLIIITISSYRTITNNKSNSLTSSCKK